MSTKPNHFTIYVPARRTDLPFIARGSAIVAASESFPGDMTHIYFEGNLYDAVNLRTFEERVICAAGRLREKYPTVATAVIASVSLIEIGALHYEQRKITIIDQAALDEWLAP